MATFLFVHVLHYLTDTLFYHWHDSVRICLDPVPRRLPALGPASIYMFLGPRPTFLTG